MGRSIGLLNKGVDILLGTPEKKHHEHVSPIIIAQREDASEVKISVYEYNETFIEKHEFSEVEDCSRFRQTKHTTWINIDGLRKKDVETVSNYYDIHPLITEDILSINQRPKADEIDNILFCLLNMLYFNETTNRVELEQISIVLGKDFLISFQEDASRDVFNPIREKLKITTSKLRQRGPDYLCYSMLDMIVDNYFIVMEKLGECIE
ncbi:MAG TPA: CorA family divalent cation transporter, partial [Chitinophagaceae bacterium]|nr:CorA family divalent cation transporter [Chitinophagaceae bacterium]